jgi:Family of unknown function (DUF6114)
MTANSTPVAAFVISLLGGVFILAGGLVVLVQFLTVAPSAGIFLGVSSVYLPLLGVIVGPAIILLAVLFYRRPEHPGIYGGLVIALSLVSYASFLGGLFAGLILGVVGGVLILTWHPSKSPSVYYGANTPNAFFRPCPRCGRVVPADSRVCPACGITFA